MRKSRAALGAAVFLSVLAPARADAFAIKRSSSGEVVKWSRAQVAWTIDPSMAEVAGAAEAAVDATKQWSGRRGAPKLEPTTASAPREPGYDGVSGTIFVAGGYAPAGHALAVTIVSFDDRSGAILDADVVVNGRYTFERMPRASNAPTAAAGAPEDPADVEVDQHDAREDETYDIARVVAHETGHALGLGDEPDHRDAVMYPYVAPAKLSRTAPATDDLDGLDALYDPDGKKTKRACSAAAGRLPGGMASAIALGAGALVVVLVSRRRRHAGSAGVGIALAALVAPPVGAPLEMSVGAEMQALPAWADARGSVTAVDTSIENGVFRSTLTVSTASCRARCPGVVHVTAWGGVRDGIRQEVAGRSVPRVGERVDVAFDPEARAGSAVLARVGDAGEGVTSRAPRELRLPRSR